MERTAQHHTIVRWRALRYLATFTLPLGAWATFTDRHGWYWTVPMVGFVLVPLLELVVRGRPNVLSEEAERAVLADPFFDMLLYAIVPVQYGLLYLFLDRVRAGGLAPGELLGCVAAMGVLCGVYGINVAHELGHRTHRWERDLARALLLTSLYMHFIIEHNRGHHRRVATPDDPASARYGETVYAFWLRSIVFSWRSAWHIEADRLRKAGHVPVGVRNEMVQALFWQGALLLVIGTVFGPNALAAFLGAALLGVLLLETVNYIEHYGLRRKRTAGGSYGRVHHVHSWNSDHLLGRIMLFELTRHSDHHWKASKKFQALNSVAEAPQLPTGYPGTMLLSLVPPLFFAVMHPRLDNLVANHEQVELAG
ncbi:MAG: alkane 1-monooxygenase [Flavobacteriales bacterium]|nr:alkane 1-monooxygenase [Flavobacteriales bacterium]